MFVFDLMNYTVCNKLLSEITIRIPYQNTRNSDLFLVPNLKLVEVQIIFFFSLALILANDICHLAIFVFYRVPCFKLKSMLLLKGIQ